MEPFDILGTDRGPGVTCRAFVPFTTSRDRKPTALRMPNATTIATWPWRKRQAQAVMRLRHRIAISMPSTFQNDEGAGRIAVDTSIEGW